MMLGAMVILNLFIGVIMTGMEEAQAELQAEVAQRGGALTPEARVQKLLTQLDDIKSELKLLAGSSDDA